MSRYHSLFARKHTFLNSDSHWMDNIHQHYLRGTIAPLKIVHHRRGEKGMWQLFSAAH